MYQNDNSLWGKIFRWLWEKKLFWPAMVILALLSLVLFGPFGILTAISIGVVMFKYFRIKIQETIRAQKQQRQFAQAQKQYVPIADKILKVMNQDLGKSPREMWAEFNKLVQELGIVKKHEVYWIREDVFNFLCTVTPEGYAQQFARKMLLFYFEIASSYTLDQREQNELLFYLRWCFRNDGGKTEIGDGDRYFYQYLFPDEPNLDKQDKRVLNLLEIGCDKNFAYAKHLLANCYCSNELVLQRDYDKAFSLYRQAAEQGIVYAIYRMGQCYENAYGTKQNFQKAGDCYQYAFECSRKKEFAEEVDRLYTAGKWDKRKYKPDLFGTDKEMKKENLDELSAAVAKWERTDLAEADGEMVGVALRRILEKVVNSFVECYEEDSMKDNLSEKCKLLSRKGYFTKEIDWKARKVRQLGNRGAHDDNGGAITESELRENIQNIRDIVEYYRQY